MAKRQSRVIVGFSCTVCKAFNYVTEKNKVNSPEPLSLNKYCKVCKKVTKHKEEKKLD